MKFIAQLISVIFVVGIFGLSVFGRQFERAFPQSVGMLPLIGVTALIGFVVFGALTLHRRTSHPSVTTQDIQLPHPVVIFITGLILLGAFESIIELPIERIHLVKYASLSVALTVALRPASGQFPLARTLFVGTIIGIVDECIQYFVPERFFDLKDIVLNTLGVLIGVIIAVLLFQMRRTLRDRMNVRSTPDSGREQQKTCR